jgi:hypothetical protein
MKTLCPRCQSSVVYEMTDGIRINLIDQLFSPTVMVSLSVSICKAFKVHPAIGVIVGTAIASIAEITNSHNTLPILVNKQYRCSNCNHMFSTFN